MSDAHIEYLALIIMGLALFVATVNLIPDRNGRWHPGSSLVTLLLCNLGVAASPPHGPTRALFESVNTFLTNHTTWTTILLLTPAFMLWLALALITRLALDRDQ